MSTALIIVAAALLLIPCYARLGLLNPVSVTVMLWLAIGLLLAAHPFQLVEPSIRVAVAVVAGLTALCLPPLLLPGLRRRGTDVRPKGPPRAGRLEVRVWALGLAAVLVLSAAVYGVLAYRSAISAALGGTPFSQLDPTLVRWAELYGNVKISSAANIALGLAPLLGAIAVIGGLCHRWWWYLLLPVALLIVTQSPSRTATLGVVVASVFFFLLLAKNPEGPLKTRGFRLQPGRLLTLLTGVGALALAYFSYIGNSLGKAGAVPGLFPARWVPSALVEPLEFQLGGLSAFTVELSHPTGPGGPYGHFGRSMYAVVKLAQGLGIPLPGPDPFAAYVNIPVPFNTYSAFGDTYFDLGLVGVVCLFLLMGVVVHVFSRWPVPGHPVSLWVLSVMAVVLTDSAVDMRFLDVDVVVQAVAGALMVALVLRVEKTPRTEARREPAPEVAEGGDQALRGADRPAEAVR